MATKPADGTCTVRLDGEMTIYTAADQKTLLFDELEKCDTLALDLGEVSELDSAGVQVLMALKRSADQAECELQLVNHSPSAKEVLTLFGLDTYFDDQAPAPADGDKA